MCVYLYLYVCVCVCVCVCAFNHYAAEEDPQLFLSSFSAFLRQDLSLAPDILELPM